MTREVSSSDKSYRFKNASFTPEKIYIIFNKLNNHPNFLRCKLINEFKRGSFFPFLLLKRVFFTFYGTIFDNIKSLFMQTEETSLVALRKELNYNFCFFSSEPKTDEIILLGVAFIASLRVPSGQ